jgi:hypothetical protein
MRTVLLFGAALVLLTGGCAMDRLVEVKISRQQSGAVGHDGLTESEALDLFRVVSGQLDFVVNGPIQASRDRIQYTARAVANRPKSSVFVEAWIEREQILFICSIYGTEVDIAAAKRAATLFERELRRQGIQYETSERKATLIAP